MAEAARAICCPNKEDHQDYDKRLLVLDERALYVHCKGHGWIKIEFMRGDRLISFDNVAVTATSMPPKHHFELDQLPVLAVGKFGKKR